jgi:hypothetical protein
MTQRAVSAPGPPRSLALAGALAALALAASGCVTYRAGVLAAAANGPLPIPMTTVAAQVEGRSCIDETETGFRLAIDDAIRQAPGANALVEATLTFERLCLVVRGRAVRVEAARAEP